MPAHRSTITEPSPKMGENGLFKWEDASALRHHCGFCERPLSHPSAKTFCFGVHEEPCRRFHQGLFMRNRAHQCLPCITADEAHHKRHTEIAELLRRIYGSCGFNVFLVPSTVGCSITEYGSLEVDEEEIMDNYEATLGIEDGKKMSKKQRKTAKKLAKAAGRHKVITAAEIEYLGRVLHLVEDNGEDGDAPANLKEVDEIERNLRYNAHVYNSGVSRSLVVASTDLKDYDINFEAEMDRILEALKIVELLKINSRNRGLRGKELKAFESTVSQLKHLVVEDLLIVKKDEMETRMRRAGYLRYVNRESFDVLMERRKVIDSKTGEKIVRTESDEDVKKEQQENIAPKAEASTPKTPVTPTLEEDDCGDSTLDAQVADRRNILGDRASGPGTWDQLIACHHNAPYFPRSAVFPPENDDSITPISNGKGKAKAVDTDVENHTFGPPKASLPPKSSDENAEEIVPEAAASSKKKAKKAKRNAEWKARKLQREAAEKEETQQEDAESVFDDTELLAELAELEDHPTQDDETCPATPETADYFREFDREMREMRRPDDSRVVTKFSDDDTDSHRSYTPYTPSEPARHTDWKKFEKYIVDFGTGILRSEPDRGWLWPWMDPIDPLKMYVVLPTRQKMPRITSNDKYPASSFLSVGPYNYLHAQRIMRHFDTMPFIAGRTITVDAKLLDYVQMDQWVEGFPLPKGAFDVIRTIRAYNKRLGYNRKFHRKVDQARFEHLAEGAERHLGKMCWCGGRPGDNVPTVVCRGLRCKIGVFHEHCAYNVGFEYEEIDNNFRCRECLIDLDWEVLKFCAKLGL